MTPAQHKEFFDYSDEALSEHNKIETPLEQIIGEHHRILGSLEDLQEFSKIHNIYFNNDIILNINQTIFKLRRII